MSKGIAKVVKEVVVISVPGIKSLEVVGRVLLYRRASIMAISRMSLWRPSTFLSYRLAVILSAVLYEMVVAGEAIISLAHALCLRTIKERLLVR